MNRSVVRTILFALVPLISTPAFGENLRLAAHAGDARISGEYCTSGKHPGLGFAASLPLEALDLSASERQRASELILGAFGIPEPLPTPPGPDAPGVHEEFQALVSPLELGAALYRREKLIAQCSYRPLLDVGNSASGSESSGYTAFLGFSFWPGTAARYRTCTFPRSASVTHRLRSLRVGDALKILQRNGTIVAGRFRRCGERCVAVCSAR